MFHVHLTHRFECLYSEGLSILKYVAGYGRTELTKYLGNYEFGQVVHTTHTSKMDFIMGKGGDKNLPYKSNDKIKLSRSLATFTAMNYNEEAEDNLKLNLCPHLLGGKCTLIAHTYTFLFDFTEKQNTGN